MLDSLIGYVGENAVFDLIKYIGDISVAVESAELVYSFLYETYDELKMIEKYSILNIIGELSNIVLNQQYEIYCDFIDDTSYKKSKYINDIESIAFLIYTNDKKAIDNMFNKKTIVENDFMYFQKKWGFLLNRIQGQSIPNVVAQSAIYNCAKAIINVSMINNY